MPVPATDAIACIDARRGEVFAEGAGVPAAARSPQALAGLAPRAAVVVGDGAVRYRAELEAADLVVPPDDDPRHAPAARLLAGLAAADGLATAGSAAVPAPSRRRGGRVSSDLLDATGSDAPGAPIEIRRLTLEDLQAVEAIERRSYQTPWSRSMFAGELAKATGLCLGAFTGERLCAYLIVARYVDAWHVMNIAVDVDSRRRGIAERLLLELFALTDRDGSRGYTLEVRVSNAGAIRLYERLGFLASGVRRGYYTDNREDALIMWRHPPGSVPDEV